MRPTSKTAEKTGYGQNRLVNVYNSSRPFELVSLELQICSDSSVLGRPSKSRDESVRKLHCLLLLLQRDKLGVELRNASFGCDPLADACRLACHLGELAERVLLLLLQEKHLSLQLVYALKSQGMIRLERTQLHKQVPEGALKKDIGLPCRLCLRAEVLRVRWKTAARPARMLPALRAVWRGARCSPSAEKPAGRSCLNGSAFQPRAS